MHRREPGRWRPVIRDLYEERRGPGDVHEGVWTMKRLVVAISIGALLCMPAMAGAQAPTAPSASPPSKSSVKVDMVPSLFVMNAHGARLQGQTLPLTGGSPT